MNWWIVLFFAALYLVIGAYVAYYSVRAGYVQPVLSILEWLLLVASWPYTIYHIKREDRRRKRFRSAEDYFEEWGGGDQ